MSAWRLLILSCFFRLLPLAFTEPSHHTEWYPNTETLLYADPSQRFICPYQEPSDVDEWHYVDIKSEPGFTDIGYNSHREYDVNPLGGGASSSMEQNWVPELAYDYMVTTSGHTSSSADPRVSQPSILPPDKSERRKSKSSRRRLKDTTHKIEPEHRDRVHKALSDSWPRNLDKETRRKWNRLLGAYIHVNPRILLNMFDGDRSAWEEALQWSAPEEMMKRCDFDAYHRDISDEEPEEEAAKDANPGTDTRWVGAAWLAGKIACEDRNTLLTRLLLHWPGATGAAVNSRLLQYAKAFGKIQSPEPLLASDHETFRIAADHVAIGPVGRRYFKILRHPDAGPDDMLHQYSPQYSILSPDGTFQRIDVVKTQRRPTARRYHTGQGWLQGITMDEIDRVHDLVASHWVPTISNQDKAHQFALLNEQMQQNKGALQDIKDGNDKVAWRFARAIAAKNSHMKYPEEYQPSDEYMKRLGLD